MIKKRIFKTKTFSKWFNKSELTNENLIAAVNEMELGLYEANMGANLYKKRVAIGNSGKSRGARVVVATKLKKHWFFIYAFAKNERSNIDNIELLHFQKLAEVFLNFSEKNLMQLLKNSTLIEVEDGNG